MAYKPLESFPQFDVAHLGAVSVSPHPEPSIQNARKDVGIYIEAPDIQNPEDTNSKIVGAYADVGQRLSDVVLPSFIEVEVLRTSGAYRICVMARDHRRDSIGGIFLFGNYVEACLHVAAWIWYATHWIATSSKPLEGDSGMSQPAIRVPAHMPLIPAPSATGRYNVLKRNRGGARTLRTRHDLRDTQYRCSRRGN
jgi:hypothetical protein